MIKKLSILIPVYNEATYLGEVLDKVLAAPVPGGLTKELVIVDDCSTDGTRDWLRGFEKRAAKLPARIKVLYQEKNQGKGAAIRRALEAATGDVVIFQDADLEYDPKDYPALLTPILENKADVVYGSRFTGSPRRVLFFWHSLGNSFLTGLSNMLTNLNLTDMETCYKAFRMECLRHIRIRSDRFGIEPEITAKLAKLKFRFYEASISYYGRDYWE